MPGGHRDPVIGVEHEIRGGILGSSPTADAVDVEARAGEHALDISYRTAGNPGVGLDLKRPDIKLAPRFDLARRGCAAGHGRFIGPALGRQVDAQNARPHLRQEPCRRDDADEIGDRECDGDPVGERGARGLVYRQTRYGVRPCADRRGFREGTCEQTDCGARVIPQDPRRRICKTEPDAAKDR